MRCENVLVTGGGGRLGRYVVADLAGHCRVSVLDRDGGSPPPDHTVDILDLESLARATRGHDGLIHLAAIDASVSAPDEAIFDTNVRGTWNVLQAAQQAGVRKAVICSSVSATGIDSTNRHLPPLYLPIDEAHSLRPSRAYGLSKQLDECIAQSFARRGGMTVTCLRPAWVMFPDVVRDVLIQLGDPASPTRASAPTDRPDRIREPFPLLRSYVDPQDLARAFRLALELDGSSYEVVFVTAADTFHPTPTLPHLREAYGSLPEIRKPEVYERDPRASAHDIARAREVLGWRPTTTWAQVASGGAAPTRG